MGSLLVGLFGGAASPGTGGGPEPTGGDGRRYIVMLEDSVVGEGDARGLRGVVDELVGQRVGRLYPGIRSFAAALGPAEVEAMAADDRVRAVEVDRVVRAAAQTTPTGVNRVAAPDVDSQVIPNLGIDGRDDARVDADIAVIDTGIAPHPDLNVVGRTDCVNSFATGCRDGSGTDGNGHGTHVAGTAAALDDGAGGVGVAPGALLWSVRILDDDGSGLLSDLVAGVEWVTARAGTIDVANISLGCADCASPALDAAITASVDAGVVYVTSAGNEGVDASRVSPANHPDMITVSALADFDGVSGGLGAPTCMADRDDTLADFSNRGRVIDVTAPGTCILSTVPGGYAEISGTSMASAHVTGAAALLAAGRPPSGRSDVVAIHDTIVATGNGGWTDDGGDGVREPLLDVSSAIYSVAGASASSVVLPLTGLLATTTTTTTPPPPSPSGNALPEVGGGPSSVEARPG